MRTLDLETNARSADGIDVVRKTIGAHIRRHAELQPDHPAVAASGFAPLSYKQLQFVIDHVRTTLRLAGLSRDARIAISMGDGPQGALAIVAVACSAVSIPLDPRQTLSENEKCFAAIRPDALLVVEGSNSAARSLAERKDVTIIEAAHTQGTLGFSIAPPKSGIGVSLDDPDPEAPAFILQTSGTAAEPKLVPYSHRNMLAAAARCQTWFDLTPQDRCLSVSPVFYAHGLKITVCTPFLTGGTVTFPKDAAKFDYSEWFGELKPTWYSAGPTLHRLVLDQSKSRANVSARHSLRFILSSGAPLSRDVLKGLEDAMGVSVLEHYSSSEASLIAANLPKPGYSKLGTCGIPWPDSLIVMAPDGRQLPSGKHGDVLVRGPTVISEYLNALELSRTRFVAGWFKTGDIGSIDEEGFLTVHSRKDDLINRGGEKISPVEVDDALMRHPAIAEAAAYAVPHPRLGEDIAAAIVLRPGMTVRPVELRQFLREQLGAFKVPRRIVIRDQLPKGQTGKVLRRQLADTAAESRITATQLVENAPLDSNLVLQLTELWQRLLKISPISVDDDFIENGGDSLLAVEMVAEVEQVTGLTVPNSILFEATTIRQLAQRLSKRAVLNEKPKALIRLNSSGSRTPLFFFHSEVDGEGYSAIQLARLLGSDQPFFVVAPHGMGIEPVPRSIEAMAADRLPLIMDAQPEGPYRLFGSCVGGLVVFELARLLVAAGREVEMVIMLDPPVISARRSVQLLLSTIRSARPVVGPMVDRAMRRTFRICAELDRFYNRTWPRRLSAIKTRLKNVVRGGNSPSIEVSPFKETVAERDATYEVAMSNYVPKPLAVPVVYISVDYRGEAWRRMSSTLEIHKSPGSHFRLDYDDIARHLRPRLQVHCP